MTDAFSVISSALPPTTRVLAFRGTEAISAPYEIQIHLWIEDPAFDMGAAIGADMTLSIHREDGQPCVFHGVLATIETVDDLERGSVYRVPSPRYARSSGAGWWWEPPPPWRAPPPFPAARAAAGASVAFCASPRRSRWSGFLAGARQAAAAARRPSRAWHHACSRQRTSSAAATHGATRRRHGDGS